MTPDLVDHAEVLVMALGQRVTLCRQESEGSAQVAFAQQDVDELATTMHILHERLNGPR